MNKIFIMSCVFFYFCVDVFKFYGILYVNGGNIYNIIL